jgi:hypothetical protein
MFMNYQHMPIFLSNPRYGYADSIILSPTLVFYTKREPDVIRRVKHMKIPDNSWFTALCHAASTHRLPLKPLLSSACAATAFTLKLDNAASRVTNAVY